jgi:hypothetical protein
VPPPVWVTHAGIVEIVVSDMALRVICVLFVAALLAFAFSSFDIDEQADEAPYVASVLN